MKTAIIFTLLSAMSFGALATQRTMINTDETVSGDTKTCFYEGGGKSDTITVNDEQNCPYTRTFEVN